MSSQEASTFPVGSRDHENLIQQADVAYEALSAFPSVDVQKLRLELNEVLSVIPAVRAKYPGRSLKQAFRRDPMAYDARLARERAAGIDHWTAKRRYQGRQRAIQPRTKDSTKLAQERSDLPPVEVDVRESRQKAALYHIGAVEEDQEHTEEYAFTPIDPAA